MHAFLERRIDDLARGQADAFVDHFHAGIACPHRNLLGPVGMAVQARLADQDLHAPAEARARPLHRLAHAVDPRGALVTIDWGIDIKDHIAAACGLQTEIIRIDDPSMGIRAEYIEVFVTTKPTEA